MARRLLGSSVALAALAVTAIGCGTEPASTSVVCTDFRVGADLSSATFGIKGDLSRSYTAFAQATGDLAAASSALLRDVGASCKGLSIELGADPEDARTQGKAEPETVRAWCEVAVDRFARVRPALAKARFTLRVIAPKCAVDASFQAECEEACRVDATCAEAPLEERCPRGAWAGVCHGTCAGVCGDGAPAAAEGDDDDRRERVESGSCADVCFGTCDVPMIAERCIAELEPPRCEGDVDCQNGCRASGAARASCGQASLVVRVDDADNDPAMKRIVSALERHLPAIFLASRGRADLLAGGASDLIDAAGHILNRTTEIGPMGAACGMLIGQTAADAQKNANAALGGAGKVASAVTGEVAQRERPED